MNESRSAPEQPNRDDKKKREEQQRRRLHFSFTYFITSLIMLWLFQSLFFAHEARQSEIP